VFTSPLVWLFGLYADFGITVS